MDKSSMLQFVFVLAVVGILLSGDHVAAKDCDEQIMDLKEHCWRFVRHDGKRIPPSEHCCHAVRTAEASCVCSHANKSIELHVSILKAIYVAKHCGNPFPPGKCGHFTVHVE